MKTIRIICVFLLVLVFIFSPFSFSNIYALSQSADTEIITGNQEWSQSRPIDTDVIIKPGATLIINNGVEINFTNPWTKLYVEGSLFVKGTVKNPVTIKSDLANGSFSIVAEPDSNVNIRNAKIINGGSQAFIIGQNINVASAASYAGAVQINGGSVDIQNTTFENNLYAIVAFGVHHTRVNRSRFINNNFDVEDESVSDFRFNWWGYPEGPRKNCYDYAGTQYCDFEKIYGNLDFSDPLPAENFRDPVLIVPGILGTINGKLDPIFHIYDKLYETFEKNGYQKDVTLFTFPYEWRDSNIENAKLLQAKIAEIRQIASWPKVDIVAHSMGGLLARQYIESDAYQNDIDQMVTLGTPQNGSPEDYLAWEGGKINTEFTDVLDVLAEKAFTLEAYEKGYSSIFAYIQNRPIKSVEELLPNYNYLFDVSNNNLRAYPTNYPVNSFLDSLNSSAKIAKLNTVEFDNIIGNLSDSKSTITQIRVVDANTDPLWENGYPENFDSLLGDHGLNYGNGDGTVPFESANALAADEKITVAATHRNLPADAADEAYNLLNNTLPQSKSTLDKIKNILMFFVFSPIDIQVVAPDGSRVGKDFATGKILNEIEGAYYTGYDTDTEFLTIPNPKDGEYKILTEGTGDGSYKIEATKLTEDPIDPQKVAESTGIIEGIAATGQQAEKIVTVAGSDVITEDALKDTEPPVVTVTSPENKNYLNNLVLPISYTATDNKTVSEKITIAIAYDGNAMTGNSIDLSLQKLGAHSLKITSMDEAGNQAEKESVFNNTATINSIMINIGHYFDLGLIKDKKTRKILLAKTKDIKFLIASLDKMEASKINKEKNKLISLLKQQINHKIDKITGKIQGKKDNYKDDEGEDMPDYKNNFSIIQPAKDLLIESLDSLKYQLN